jgi:hypothetical protein
MEYVWWLWWLEYCKSTAEVLLEPSLNVVTAMSTTHACYAKKVLFASVGSLGDAAADGRWRSWVRVKKSQAWS